MFAVDMRPGEPPFRDIVCFERPVDASTEFKIVFDEFQARDSDPFDLKGPKPKFRFRLTAADWGAK